MYKVLVVVILVILSLHVKSQDFKKVNYQSRLLAKTYLVDGRPTSKDAFMGQLEMSENSKLFVQGVKYRNRAYWFLVPTIPLAIVTSNMYNNRNNKYLIYGGLTAVTIGSALLVEYIGKQKISAALSNHNAILDISMNSVGVRWKF